MNTSILIIFIAAGYLLLMFWLLGRDWFEGWMMVVLMIPPAMILLFPLGLAAVDTYEDIDWCEARTEYRRERPMNIAYWADFEKLHLRYLTNKCLETRE